MTSYTFSQLIDFTRTTSGTYTNSSGFITSTPASVNLLTYTQEFDNAAWTKADTTITANSTAAPDGTMTADTLVAAATTAAHTIRQTGGGSGSPHTLSIYAKAGTSNFIQLYHASVSTIYANFNVAAGTVGTVGAGATAAITSVGNGWYRCSITFTPGSVSTSRVAMITSATAVYAESWTAAGTETIFIWGAQLEQASSATTYTRNFGGLYPPRFDYDPVTLAPKGLLIEEQRTNLLTYSEQFDNAAWTKTRSSITANATTSPDGTADADKLVEDTSNDTHFLGQAQATATSAHTFSCYLKAGERSWATLYVSGANVGQYFNLATGVAGSTFVGAPTSSSITDAGNGWYRCSITFTATATSAARVYVAAGDANNSYTGDGTSGIYLWGAQLEAGSFATSYIPTVASQVTRTADSAVIQAPNFASWYNQSEGTFVFSGSTFDAVNTFYTAGVSASDGGTTNELYITCAQAKPNAYTRASGGTNGDLESTWSWAANTVGNVAFAYKTNDLALAFNNNAAITDSTATIPATNQLRIGQRGGSSGARWNGHIRSIRYYPVRLTNAQLQALTA